MMKTYTPYHYNKDSRSHAQLSNLIESLMLDIFPVKNEDAVKYEELTNRPRNLN